MATCRLLPALVLCWFFAALPGWANADPSSTIAPRLAPIQLIEGEEPLFETIDRARGLPNLGTNDLLVDRHGFVWIATDAGLHRFDGRNVYTIDRDPNRSDSLASRRVYRLAETPDALWIGFVDGKVQRLDMATGHLATIPMRVRDVGAPKNLTWMRSDAHGRIWLLTDLGLLRLDPATQETLLIDRKPQSVQISPDGQHLFVIADDFRITKVTARSLERHHLATLSDPDVSQSVRVVSDDHGLWLSLGTQLWRFDTASASLLPIDIPPLAIRRIVAERNGTLWMSVGSNEGLYRLDPARRKLSLYRYRPGDPHGLRVNIIKVMTISPDGDLWIGGYSGGVNRVRLRSGVGRIDLGGDRPEVICGLHEMGNRQLFVSFCGKGSVTRVDLVSGRVSDLAPQLDRNPRARKYLLIANGLIGDGGDGLWIATTYDGLLHWRPGRPVVQIPFRQELFAAFLDDKHRVWVPHVRGLAVLLPGSHELRNVSARTDAGPFEFGRTSSVSKGSNGTLWVSSPNGLFRFWPESGKVRQFTSEDDNKQSLSDNNINLTYTDRSGRLWVGTYSGLNRMIVGKEGEIRFRRYDRSDGLPDITINSMLSDRSGALWVATERGIARWDPRLDRFQGYLPTDGLPDVSASGEEAGLLGADGALYFGTDSGLWRIDPRQLQMAKPTPTVLSGYQVGESTVINLRGRGLQGIEANYLDRRLVFLFAALGDPRNLFYRLADFDDRWQSMPANLTVGYHQLPPGKYRLEVGRLDSSGRRTIELAVPVSIVPPMWRTTWAYVGYLVASATAVAWLARAYVVRRRRRYEHFRLLREKDERLRLAMSASGDVMVEIDFQNDSVTETGDEETSRPSSEPIDIPEYLGLVHPDDVEPVYQYLEALRGQHTQDAHIEYRRRSSDDDWKWVRLRGRLMDRQRKEGPYEIFTGMIHDITQERIDQEMRQRTDQLRMQAEIRGHFLAVISHEIRTPLNGVVGMVELLGSTTLNSEQRKMLDACKDSAFILLSIINDFLDLSKIEAGMLELERADVLVRDLIDTAASSFSLQALDRGIDLEIHVAPEVPACIVGDWVRLRQVLSNLISNAIKFTERGGVEVAAHMDVPGELRLMVTDTGIGMNEEQVQSLFQPFRQASAETARRFGGTGLGLSIVKQLVEIMGGHIECRSQIGEGTSFSLMVPVQDCAAPEALSRPLQGIRALVIAASDRSKILHAPLQWLGAEVEFASGVDSAVGRIRSQDKAPVDVVVIDQREPGDSHIAVLRDESMPFCVPVVVVAREQATQHESTAKTVFAAGAPLTHAALAHGIQVAMGRATTTPQTMARPEHTEPTLHTEHDAHAVTEPLILLAEDNPINREVLARQLDQLGYSCEVAEDGEEAWNLLQLHPDRYSLLITDAQMPRLDGYRLTERIREHESNGRPRIKILMITAGVLADERDRYLELGMDGFLSKPSSIAALRDKLAELLPRPSLDEIEEQSSDYPAEFSQFLNLLKGNKGQFRYFLDLFLRTARADMESLESASQRGDRQLVGQLAHKLKSACRQLGQDMAGRALEDVERAALSSQVDDTSFDGLVAIAKQELSRTQALAEKHLTFGLDL